MSSLTAAGVIWTYNAPPISNASIQFIADTEEGGRAITLPYYQASHAAPSSFFITATLDSSPFSSGILRVAYDDCLERVTVNGIEVAEVSNRPKPQRCQWWHPLALDLRPYLRDGRNSVMFTVSDSGGTLGLDVKGAYAVWAIAGMIVAVLICLAMTHLCWQYRDGAPQVRQYASNPLMRVALAPCTGLIFLCFVQANTHGGRWHDDHGIYTIAALTLALLLLVRLSLNSLPEPLSKRPSLWAAVLSIAAFAYSAATIPVDGVITLDSIVSAAVGTITGIFIFLPAIKMERFPLALSVILALCPAAYWSLNLAVWGYLAPATGTVVRGILWLCGYQTRTFPDKKTDAGGRVEDYYAYVSSADFSVQIGSWCSGLEGVALFLFLLCVFVLTDWKLFSKVRHLWAVFALTIPFVLVVNCIRIAGLFIYAVWNVREYGHTQAIWATIEAFHSNIGWVVYSVAFAVLLPLVYRWARQNAEIS